MSRRNNKPKNQDTNKPKVDDKNQQTAASAETSAAPKEVKGSSALLNAAANVSFPIAAGFTATKYSDVPEQPDPDVNIKRSSAMLGMNIPGVIRLGTVTTAGTLNNWSDPGNVWLRAVYTFIRHANSGHSNYDAAHLGKFFLLYRSCLTFYYWLQNLLGAMNNSYVPANKYVPINIVNAMGGNYHDLLHNVAQLRYYIISFGTRLAQMRVPDMPFFNRDFTLNTPVLMDTPTTDKASFYVFAPDAFWRYHIGETAEDTYLYTVPAPDGNLTDLINFGESILNELLNDEDFNIMSGDIMKAYDKYAAVPALPEPWVVSPVYDEALLWVIHNANPLCAHPDVFKNAMDRVRIYQVADEGTDEAILGALRMDFNLKLSLTNEDKAVRGSINTMLAASFDAIMDIPGEPSPAIIGELTYLMSLGKSSVNRTDFLFHLTSCQTLVVTSLCMCTKPSATSITEFVPWHTLYATNLSRFDLHPYLDYVQHSFDSGVLTVSTAQSLLGEVTNFGVLKRDTKFNIDNAVMLDMYGG